MRDFKEMKKKVRNSPNQVYCTKTYLYWIDASGLLFRAKISDIDTMNMYQKNAIKVLE